jgi:hypothetical protein
MRSTVCVSYDPRLRVKIDMDLNILESRRAIPHLGNAGCQPAAFGNLAECTFVALAFDMHAAVRGKLPRTTGQRPVLPGT